MDIFQLPFEIVEYIGSFCDNSEQLNLSLINEYTYANYHFYSLYLHGNLLFKNSMLKQDRFSRLCVLECGPKIINIKHLSSLVKLSCKGSKCRISNDEIKEMKNLQYLDCWDNVYITDIYTPNSKIAILNCGGSGCGIDQKCIEGMINLKELHCYGNSKIIFVGHLNNSLTVLNCGGEHSKIGQDSIEKLTNLSKLYCYNNELINNIDHLEGNLTELTCSGRYNTINKRDIP